MFATINEDTESLVVILFLLSSSESDSFCKNSPCSIFFGSGNWSIYEIWALFFLSSENKGCNTLRGNLSEMAYEGYNQDQLIHVYMRYCYDVDHYSRAKPVNVIDIISQASQ